MATVTIHQAKTNLSRLIARAQSGETIVIARGKTPVARIVAVKALGRPKRRFGRLKGLAKLDDAFFEPLPEDLLRLWSGEGQ